ncbi:DUF72 domain-containing protein [Arcticibacter eurypsychrophilus]|uniref:DUF72 domain-containing protein n=1 Tax=Arcticibacter eurypsychrophilus TaxID=1434752 RepID=UPI001FDFD330|nr:DUF72 domain-containing protein [Arcticibacter eurypsychrophilus]
MDQIQSKDQTLYFSGTSGIVLPFPNKQFYPLEFQDKSRLTYYGTLFNSVEINSSFYKVPMASTVAKWASEVPEDFRFTFKLWKEITHSKGLEFKPEDVDRFINTISQAGHKKGCLLVQFPPSLKIQSIEKVNQLLMCIQDADSSRAWNVTLEFRNNSLYQKSTYDLLNQYHAGMVFHDKTGSVTPFTDVIGNVVYVRFHGPNGNYRESYAESFLYEYAQYIQEWMDDGKAVYVYFNNTMGDAVDNLKTLNSFLYPT